MSMRGWVLVLSLLVTGMSWAAESQTTRDVRELFEIIGVKQYVSEAGPQLEAAAQTTVDELIAEVGASSLTDQQRTLFDAARVELAAVAKDSLAELETKAAEAFEQSFTQVELQTLLDFARIEVGRALFKRMVQAGNEGKEPDISDFTPVELAALREWAMKPDFGSMLEKFPTMDARLRQAVVTVMQSLEKKVLEIGAALSAKLR